MYGVQGPVKRQERSAYPVDKASGTTDHFRIEQDPGLAIQCTPGNVPVGLILRPQMRQQSFWIARSDQKAFNHDTTVRHKRSIVVRFRASIWQEFQRQESYPQRQPGLYPFSG
jgi:hypothetical protein